MGSMMELDSDLMLWIELLAASVRVPLWGGGKFCMLQGTTATSARYWWISSKVLHAREEM